MNKVLIVVAHPDDEVYNCGGVLIKHVAMGDAISISIFGGGRTDKIDQRFETLPLVDIISWVEDAIRSSNANIIYTHCSSDVNRDHRIVNEAVLIATRPPCSVKEVYGFEGSSFWTFGQFGSFNPNVFVDITDNMDEKLESLKKYPGELGKYPHNRSPEKIAAVAEYWGRTIEVPYAEAFELIRMVK